VTARSAPWTPGIGDPTVGGWVIAAAYAVAVLLCVICARRADAQSVQRRVWFGIGTVMSVIGINKQLDLQTWFTQTAREIATAGNWYEDRFRVQLAFVALVSAAGLIGLSMLWPTLRHSGAGLRIAVLGLVVTFAFILIRSTSVHEMDQLLRLQAGGLGLKWVLEFGGAVGVVAGATTALIENRQRRIRPHVSSSR
jgi:hypothetical protein